MTLIERIKNEMMVIKSLGVVYGDIGTSPIYTLGIVLLFLKPTPENIMQVLSLIAWTMMLLVTVQYAWLATSLSKKGEGGTVVLVQILLPYLKHAKSIAIVSFLGFIGISLLIGDGVITPAISILSAVEGISLIPGYENISKNVLLLIATVVTFILFVIQKRGIENVANAFGPIMVIWFFVLGLGGGYYVLQHLEVLKALSPYYAINFIIQHPNISFVVLADVLLCATGGEALYADMGHMGRLPILKGWLFAAVTLLLSYYGQGAYLLTHPQAASNPFFSLYHSLVPSLYIPILLLSILATVIASQAMISGIFSVLYQAMTTRIFPHLHVKYTSNELRSQIYVGSVNWFLFICVIIMLFIFKESAKLASAYGLSVAGAMSITGMLMSMIFMYKQNYLKMVISISVAIISTLFFVSCWLKIPNGGYWSLIIASIPLFIVILYTQGQKRLYNALIPVEKELFLSQYSKYYKKGHYLVGTALFFARRIDAIPAYIAKTMFTNGILYKRNIVIIVQTSSESHGVSSSITNLATGLDLLTIRPGYMEQLNVQNVLSEHNIDERVIFYGDEEIVSNNIFWKIFAAIKELSPSFVSFYNFPREKLIGVARRAEI
ncbi:MAG: KUP/HAK/KT family potassium transporter [Thiovulaceae bacterium]|nr:KUP/HAK/KT family potassium transporter [Sulfurimonadaceae bacterium]